MEVGIDPIYEPGNMSILSGEASSGFVSDLIGTSSTDITPNDNNALVLTSGGASSKIETVFVFKNIRSKYIASLAMTNKICFSVNNVTFKYSIYDNATSS